MNEALRNPPHAANHNLYEATQTTIYPARDSSYHCTHVRTITPSTLEAFLIVTLFTMLLSRVVWFSQRSLLRNHAKLLPRTDRLGSTCTVSNLTHRSRRSVFLAHSLPPMYVFVVARMIVVYTSRHAHCTYVYCFVFSAGPPI